MQIGLVGLGPMGFNLALNLKNKGHDVIAYDLTEATRNAIQQHGIKPVKSLRELAESVYTKRVIWLTIPANICDETLAKLQPFLSVSDIVVDCTNSNHKESVIRAHRLEALQIDYLDCGIIGGEENVLQGICAAIGGNRFAFNHCEPLFHDISIKGGFVYCGKSGSGHFVKMMHEGIASGVLQSVAEGFEVMQKSEYNLNLEKVDKLWNNCSELRTRI